MGRGMAVSWGISDEHEQIVRRGNRVGGIGVR